MDLSDLWVLFYETRDLELRNQLIQRYLGVVSYIVRKIIKMVNLPSGLSREDLIGFGTIGLIQAVERFNPYQGVKFETYAIRRIKGEIVDNLRRLSFISRNTVKLIQEKVKTEERLEQRLMREITAYELEIEFNNNGNNKFLPQQSRMLSLFDVVYRDREESLTLLDMISRDNEIDPLVKIEQEELTFQLMRWIRKLTTKERFIIGLYYFEKKPFRYIGEILGVTESRVAQIHSEAINKLRNRVRIYFTGP